MISYKILKLGIFTEMLLKIKIFWDVTRCGFMGWLALIIRTAKIPKFREYVPISMDWLKFYETAYNLCVLSIMKQHQTTKQLENISLLYKDMYDLFGWFQIYQHSFFHNSKSDVFLYENRIEK